MEPKAIKIWQSRPQWWDYTKFNELLTDSQHVESRRFRFEADRNAFVLSHALLRTKLSEAFNLEPKELQFGRTRRGRPVLTYPAAQGLAFSASRRREIVVIAFAPVAQLGVDIEKIVAIENPEALLSKFLDQTSIAHLPGHPGPDQHRRFARLWTITEACAKARGTGLETFTPRLSVSFETADRAIVRDGPNFWRCQTFAADPDHYVTVAYAAPQWLPLELNQWTGLPG